MNHSSDSDPTPHSSELDKLYEPYKVHHKDVECFNDHVAVTHLKQATQRLIARERQKAVDEFIEMVSEILNESVEEVNARWLAAMFKLNNSAQSKESK